MVNLGRSRTLHVQRISGVSKRIIHTTYPNLVLMGSPYEINERTGMEGLELMVSNRGRFHAGNWTVDSTLTYSLRYTSSALSSGLQFAGTWA